MLRASWGSGWGERLVAVGIGEVGVKLYTCGRCKKRVNPDTAEVCWWCIDFLCYDCWDGYGHCGHPEAEAQNERARAMQQPPVESSE